MTCTESLPTVNAVLNGCCNRAPDRRIHLHQDRPRKSAPLVHGECVRRLRRLSIGVLCAAQIPRRQGVHTPFGGEGAWQYVFTTLMLATHIVLAMAIVPLVLTTLTLAIKGKRERASGLGALDLSRFGIMSL